MNEGAFDEMSPLEPRKAAVVGVGKCHLCPNFRMPRYFFHTQNDSKFIDEDGTELPDFLAARNHAVIVAGELLKSVGCRGWSGTQLRLWVTDESGTTVCNVSVSVKYDQG